MFLFVLALFVFARCEVCDGEEGYEIVDEIAQYLSCELGNTDAEISEKIYGMMEIAEDPYLDESGIDEVIEEAIADGISQECGSVTEEHVFGLIEDYTSCFEWDDATFQTKIAQVQATVLARRKRRRRRRR